jgi:di/tricarboxylate transporter
MKSAHNFLSCITSILGQLSEMTINDILPLSSAGADAPWLDHCPCPHDEQRYLATVAPAKTTGELWEILVVSITVFFMFAILLSDRIGADWVMIAGLTIFMACQIITISEGLGGFSNEGILTVLVLFVVAEGISRTGALDWYMGKVLGHPKSIAGAQIRLMVPIATLSAFLNNTPIVAVMIPITLRWARNIGVPRQQLMIPLSFATILGGTCTLIGTSTNLVVSGLLLKYYPKEPKIGLFDLGVYGVPVAIFGLSYIMLAAPFSLPGGRASKNHALDPLMDADELLLGARLTPWSPAAGRTVKRSGLRDSGGIYLVSVHRASTGNVHHAVSPDFVLSVGDVVYFTGLIEEFGEFCEEHGLEVVTNEVKDDLQLQSSEVADDFPVEVGVTKESMIEYDESERQRSINKITDQIRERTPLAAGETGTSPSKIVVVSDSHDRAFVVGVDAPDRPGLLLDISKGLLRLNLQVRHTEAKVLGERSLSIWRCECVELTLPDLEEVWSVLHALLGSASGVAAIKNRGLRVIRAVITSSSRLIGTTALNMKFRETYKAAIVAVQKGGKNTSTDTTFEAGDVLILQAGNDSPLLTRPPDDFYAKLQKLDEASRPSLVKLFSSSKISKGDLKASSSFQVHSGEASNTSHDKFDADRNSEFGNTTMAKNEVIWKDLQVVFEVKKNATVENAAFQKEFLTAMEVPAHSALENKSVNQLGIAKLPGVFLVSIERPSAGSNNRQEGLPRANVATILRGLTAGPTGSENNDTTSVDGEPVQYTAITPDDALQAGDVLWFSGSASAIGDLRKIPGLQSYQNDEVRKMNTSVQERRLVQAVVARRSPLVGKTVKEARFRTQYDAAVIAVHREGNRVHDHPGQIKLQAGDVLLLEASPTFLSKNSDNYRTFALLAVVDDSAPPRLGLFFLAVFLTVTMLLVYSIQGTSLLITALVAAIFMVSFGVLSQQEARDAIKWDIFVTIGAAFGISAGLTNSGVAGGLASFLVDIGMGIGIGGEI